VVSWKALEGREGARQHEIHLFEFFGATFGSTGVGGEEPARASREQDALRRAADDAQTVHSAWHFARHVIAALLPFTVVANLASEAPYSTLSASLYLYKEFRRVAFPVPAFERAKQVRK